jgi:hypothetical protein
MSDQLPEWVERYHRDTGQWPPGWSPGERRAAPLIRTGAGIGALLLAAAIIGVLALIAWMFLG